MACPPVRSLIVASVLLVGSCTLPADRSVPEPLPGLFGVIEHETTVRRPDGSTFTAAIFEPAAINKEGVPAARIAYPIPAVAFGHGFVQPPSQYSSTLSHLASHGYIVIAPASALELIPSHQQLADDLRQCLTFLEAETINQNSPWSGKVDAGRLGMIGHSMGGGAAILAAAVESRIKVLATLSAADTRPSSLAVAPSVIVPSLFIVGDADTYIPPEESLAIYDAMAVPRVAIRIDGGFHCGFVDNAIPGCDDGGITRTEQLAAIWPRLVSFLNLYLMQMPEARDELLAPAAGLTIINDLD